FAETGLLIGFFLPGDSLLFTAGLLCTGSGQHGVKLSLPPLLVAPAVGAVARAPCGYLIRRNPRPTPPPPPPSPPPQPRAHRPQPIGPAEGGRTARRGAPRPLRAREGDRPGPFRPRGAHGAQPDGRRTACARADLHPLAGGRRPPVVPRPHPRRIRPRFLG